MGHRQGLLFAAALCLSLCACAHGGGEPSAVPPPRVEKAPPGPIHHVVLITVDGLMPDSYLHPESHGLRIPTLKRLVAQGAASDGARSVFPSVTYPSHTSIVTGVDPAKHGIFANRSFDPMEDDLEGWRWYAEDIQRDPVWRVAHRAGYRVGMVHWPVSVGARVDWVAPEYWRAKNDNDRKLVRALSTPGLLEAVAQEHPDFWPRFLPPASHDDALTDIALHVLEREQPHLLLLHLVEVDGAQHHHGVWSKEALAAIENADQQIGRVLALIARSSLASDTSVVVASDHGFMDAGSMVRPGVLLREANLVSINPAGRVVDWKAAYVGSSGQAYLYVKDPADTATKDTLRRVFAAKAAAPGSGIGRVYDEGAIRARGGDPGAFLALEPAAGFQFGNGCAGDYVTPPMYHATHGFDPERPEMKASLILFGPNVAHGTLPGARLVDVAPTVARWLGLSMGEVDGKPLEVTPAR